LPVPVEIRPHVGAALSARLANQAALNAGQPEINRPAIATDRHRMAAAVIGAINRRLQAPEKLI